MNKIKNFWGRIASTCGLATLLMFSAALTAQTAPPLGVAGNFAVLGGSTVTNTGLSAIAGDLGVSPGTSVTGFPPGVVSGGIIRINDAVAQQAQSDLTTAYNALAGQAFNTDLTGQDLGGLTLPPSVYRFSTSAQLTGTLVLDAQGNPNAVFIFQIGSTLTTASNARVQVINGGSNCNVFFQVGSSATLGTGTQFAGNILALASITATTGSTVAGRLLARNGAVTLDTNIVAVCPAVCNPITLAPVNLPAATANSLYSQTITASGGTAPYAFSLSGGTLPPGLSLSSSGASSVLLSGTPTTPGSFTFTVTATDAAGCIGFRVYTIVVNPAACPTIELAPATLPAGISGAAYSQNLLASGGASPYAFTVSAGALPPGLNLVPGGAANATISGTPTTAGNYTFTITATDANGCLGSRVYTIVIANPACPTIVVAPATLPAAISGTPYSQAITASGGAAPYSFSVSAGALPPGLSFSANGASSVLLSGTPLTPGSFTFTVTATDANGCLGVRQYTIVVTAPVCPAIVLAPATLPAIVSGVAFSQILSASGGTAPYTFTLSSGTLPPGLTLSPSGNAAVLLSGTPTSTGNFTFTIQATDSLGCIGFQTYTLVVNPPVCPLISLTPATLPLAIVGTPYSQTLTASGGTAPYTFAVTSGALPPGLVLSNSGPSSALLAGTITTAGSYTFTITATDAAGCRIALVYTVTVSNPACPLIILTPATLPFAVIGVPYSQTITASGGAAPYAFTLTIGQLPPGLVLSPAGPSSVLLSGTPTALGSYSFTIRVTDANGCLTTLSYSNVQVVAQPISVPTLGIFGLLLLTGLIAGYAWISRRLQS